MKQNYSLWFDIVHRPRVDTYAEVVNSLYEKFLRAPAYIIEGIIVESLLESIREQVYEQVWEPIERQLEEELEANFELLGPYDLP